MRFISTLISLVIIYQPTHTTKSIALKVSLQITRRVRLRVSSSQVIIALRLLWQVNVENE